jgi:uncharacterized protein (DUF2141 family)
MKNHLFLVLLSVSFISSSWGFTLEVSELRGRTGDLMVAVFDDPGKFPDKAPLITKIVPVVKEDKVIFIDLNLPQGNYAVSTYLDQNRNGKLDANFLGIPKELFGFSNNPRILTGPPSYQDCEIKVESDSQKSQIRLIKIL